ncbi:acyl-CoA dehydrogenase family protein [Amycolatopsis sp. cmx-11-12]|uniref:acyl-CoA dehydrogenase family protein n=1 Tax=Amycolatopsis sp. cmx-11-12 TaxID=2785795 RepID=UPI0039182088
MINRGARRPSNRLNHKLKHGTEKQRKAILPKTASGEARFSFAITEPDAGTNTFKITTSAKRREDGSYKLSESKHFITGFKTSPHCLVVARTDAYDDSARTKGLTLFIIDPHSPGIEATEMDLGIHLPEKNYDALQRHPLLQ